MPLPDGMVLLHADDSGEYSHYQWIQVSASSSKASLKRSQEQELPIHREDAISQLLGWDRGGWPITTWPA